MCWILQLYIVTTLIIPLLRKPPNLLSSWHTQKSPPFHPQPSFLFIYFLLLIFFFFFFLGIEWGYIIIYKADKKLKWVSKLWIHTKQHKLSKTLNTPKTKFGKYADDQPHLVPNARITVYYWICLSVDMIKREVPCWLAH